MAVDTTGPGYLAGEFPGGRTTVNGVPVSAVVKAFYELPESGDWQLVSTTASGEDGTWFIPNVNPEFLFHVLGRLGGYNDVVSANVQPTRSDVVVADGEFGSKPEFNGVSGEVILVGGIPPYQVQPISPLPAGLAPALDGRTLRILGSSMEEGVFDTSVRVTASNGPYVDIPLQFEIKVLYVHATGGDETIIEIEGNRYRVHTFNDASGTLMVMAGGEVEYLIVAGGGAGGAPNAGGGGGGGGVLLGDLECAPGQYDIVVGQGGLGSNAWATGQNGEDSTAFGRAAKGGGGGGQSQIQGARGNTGGSGGGSGGRWTEGSSPAPAAGVEGQGHDGGVWTLAQDIGTFSRAGAGGGGAGGDGANAGDRVGGNGGLGLEVSLRGIAERFGGGGGGGSNGNAAGAGGPGGGGSGGIESNGTDGAPNSGGGGGGSGSAFAEYKAGSGGSGVVIVRYRIANGI